MDIAEWNMHVRAGRAFGEASTCGVKIDYRSEERAGEVAETLQTKYDKDLEAYPCAFCCGWHVGRRMTDEERKEFTE